MAALSPGSKAPDFKLRGLDGKTHSLPGLEVGQVAVLAFYKESCPVCVFSFPFLEGIYKYVQSSPNVRFFAVAQEDEQGAKGFASRLRLTMPQVLDGEPYTASSRYGLTNVPTVVVVGPDGTVKKSIVGFVKKDYEGLANLVADAAGRDHVDLFEGIDVPEVRPG